VGGDRDGGVGERSLDSSETFIPVVRGLSKENEKVFYKEVKEAKRRWLQLAKKKIPVRGLISSA